MRLFGAPSGRLQSLLNLKTHCESSRPVFKALAPLKSIKSGANESSSAASQSRRHEKRKAHGAEVSRAFPFVSVTLPSAVVARECQSLDKTATPSL